MSAIEKNQAQQYWAVVPAAGVGSRMASQIPKQYLKLGHKTILEHSIAALQNHPKINGVVVAVSKNDTYWQELNMDSTKRVIQAEGGKERCHSVYNGLCAIADIIEPSDWVLVHDAARPCLRYEDLDKLMTELASHAVGGLLAVPVRDTLKKTQGDNLVSQTIDRAGLWQAQTPQMFRYGLLKSALLQALESEVMVTDEASAIENSGYHPKLVEGHTDNIKITLPEDLALAEHYLEKTRLAKTRLAKTRLAKTKI